MLDYKSEATPMDANFKKLKESTSNSDIIDPTMYHQLIGSLMYLTNTRPNICFVVNTLRSLAMIWGRFIGFLQNMFSNIYVLLWDMV